MAKLIHDVTTVTFSDSDLLHISLRQTGFYRRSSRPGFNRSQLPGASAPRDSAEPGRLKRFYKPGDCVSVALGHPAKCIARARGLTTMPKNGLGDIARSPIVQQFGVSADCGQEANPPEWGSAPFSTTRLVVVAPVGKPISHVVQQQIGIGMNQEFPLGWLRSCRRLEVG